MMVSSEAEARAWLASLAGIDPGALSRLDQLVASLVEANRRQNLVAHASLERVWQRHIVDSAQLLRVSRETIPEGPWLDLGSGAGFPGLVIATLQPQRPVTLVDSRRLRAEWLVDVVAQLGLANVEVRLARVEDLPDKTWPVISARAFAPLARLLDVAARFSTSETLWLLPKGAKAQHELAALAGEWVHMFHVEQSLTDSSAGIITGRLFERILPRRTGKTPAQSLRKRGSSR